MSLSTGLRRLAVLVEELEAVGVAVTDLTPRDVATDGGFSADLRIELPSDGPSDRIGTGEAFSRPERSDARSDSAPDEDRSGVPAPGGAWTEATSGSSANAGSPSPSTASPTPNAASADGSDGSDAAVATRRTAAAPTGPDGTAASGSEEEPTDPVTDRGDGDATDDGDVPCSYDGCDEVFDTEHGMKIHRSKVHLPGLDARSEEATPTYRDSEALREAYDEGATFEEMTAALDVDVSAQTVRQQMIRHGIHEPNSRADGAAASGEPSDPTDDPDDPDPTGRTDEGTDGTTDPAGAPGSPDERVHDREDAGGGLVDSDPETDLSEIRLPSGASATELCRAVERSKTVLEVQRELDLGRETTLELCGRTTCSNSSRGERPRSRSAPT